MWYNNKRVVSLEHQIFTLKKELQDARAEILDHNEVYKALKERYDSDAEQRGKMYEHACETWEQKCDSANAIIGKLKEQHLNDVGFQLKLVKGFVGSFVINIFLFILVVT